MNEGGRKRQLEMQLGHMCNNRCSFCVSGQETARGRAPVLETDPLLAQVRRAHEAGYRTLTLLGGEPTLQPGFLDVVREAARLGFDEIVVFTNGAKTARPGFVDEILATGGRFSWRISIQGGTREAHERTTRKDGSFARIERTLENLAARAQRITINMCVVRSNYQSVAELPALLARFAPHVHQVHLDMMRPLDAGERSEAELDDTLPPYGELAGPFARLVAGLPPGFDVNLGNLPPCVAPELAAWIHHDGEPTATISVDGAELSQPWDKYLVKRRDKVKLPTCASCAHDATCSGVYETYVRLRGTSELRPLPATLRPSVALRLRRLRAGAPFGALTWREVTFAGERATVHLEAPNGAQVRVWLDEEAGKPTGGYGVDGEVTDPLRAGVASLMESLGLLRRPAAPATTSAR